MRKRVIGAGLIILLLSFGIKFKRTHLRPSMEKEVTVHEKKQKIRKRHPASIDHKKSKLIGKSAQVPLYEVSDRKEEPDQNFEEEYSVGVEDSPTPTVIWNEVRQRGSRSLSWKGNSRPRAKTTSDPGVKIMAPFDSLPLPPTLPEEDKEKEQRGNPEQSVPESPICSVNVTGGSFQGPVQIELTCSTASTIKYCISENYCCDPEQGIVYTGAFQLGQPSKLFCLSFAGTSEKNQLTSTTKEAFYNFDPDLPHLEVTKNKIYVQTTQLDTSMTLTSNDFGSSYHSTGVINLKSNDPSPSGLNMSCDDIVTNHTTLTSPSPIYVLAEMNVNAISPSTQINLFLTEDKLIYGENNLTTYMKSMLYGAPKYSCSTSKLTLEDFYYSQTIPTDIASGDDGSELFGGFTALKVTEEDPKIYRGPASEIAVAPTEELRTGLISIFFDK